MNYFSHKKLPLSANDFNTIICDTVLCNGTDTPPLSRDEWIIYLRKVIRAGIAALAQEENTCSFREAAWESITARKHRRPATLHDLRHFVRRMLRENSIGDRPLRAISTQECRTLLRQAFSASPSSYKKGRAILHSIFAFGIRHELCSRNPVDNIEVPHIQERPIKPLGTESIQQLERAGAMHRHQDMQLSLRLLLYCGVRPAEVARLNPDRDIDWEQKVVIIRPLNSKTGGGRLIPLRLAGNLPPNARVIPGNWQKRWRELRRDAGLHHWQADACRHTFASYHAAFFRNLPALQLEMGHRDTALLFSRYMVPIPFHLAQAFWQAKTPLDTRRQRRKQPATPYITNLS